MSKHCFDAGGQIVRWSHEEPERREVEDMPFSDLLIRETRKLEGRKDRKIRSYTA